MPNPRYASKTNIPSWPEVITQSNLVDFTVQVGLHVREDKRRALPYEVFSDIERGDLLELSVWLGRSVAEGVELAAFRCGVRADHFAEDLDLLFTNRPGSVYAKLHKAVVLGPRGHISLRAAAATACEQMIALAKQIRSTALKES